MKWKKLFVAVGAVFFCTAMGLRIWYVNQNLTDLPCVTYPMGETVDIGQDYFYNSDDIYDDYSITVLSSEVMPLEEYLEKHSLTREEVFGDDEILCSTIYDLEVCLRNNNTDVENDEQFLPLLEMRLLTDTDTYPISHELLWAMYPQLDQSTFGFRIYPGTEMVMHLPFSDLSWMNLTTEEIKEKDTYWLLSMYPTERRIQVGPQKEKEGATP